MSAPAHAVHEPPVAPPPRARPDGFVEHVHGHAFVVRAPPSRVWGWLEDPKTFTEGQVWPFRVEFTSPDPGVPPGFHVGGLNAHHGPLMCFAGILTEIREGEYRDLHYFHGSHLFGLRFIRPTRLEFHVEDAGPEATRVTLRVTSFVRRWLARPWGTAQGIFWRRFARWMARSLGAGRPSAAPGRPS